MHIIIIPAIQPLQPLYPTLSTQEALASADQPVKDVLVGGHGQIAQCL